MTKQRKADYKTGQVVMIEKSDFGLPAPGTFRCYAELNLCIVDYGAFGMRLTIDQIRPLTAREAGPAAKKASSRR